MNFYILSVFCVGLVAVYAAPAPAESNLNSAFEPVAKQVRSLVDATNKAVEDLTAEAKGASGRVLNYAKDLAAPIDAKERAAIPSNIAARLLSFQDNVGAEAKSLLEKTVQSGDTLQQSGRSAFLTAGDTVQALQNKYLTQDGQELLNSFVNM